MLSGMGRNRHEEPRKRALADLYDLRSVHDLRELIICWSVMLKSLGERGIPARVCPKDTVNTPYVGLVSINAP